MYHTEVSPFSSACLFSNALIRHGWPKALYVDGINRILEVNIVHKHCSMMFPSVDSCSVVLLLFLKPAFSSRSWFSNCSWTLCMTPLPNTLLGTDYNVISLLSSYTHLSPSFGIFTRRHLFHSNSIASWFHIALKSFSRYLVYVSMSVFMISAVMPSIPPLFPS